MRINDLFINANSYINFQAKPKNLKTSVIKGLVSDVVEITHKKESLVEKLEFTPLEIEIKDLVLRIDKLEEETRLLKRNLRDYYSSEDKYDYQELMQEKRNLQSRLSRFKKKHGISGYILEFNIREKISYNNWAKRIGNTTTLESLAKHKERISDSFKISAENKKNLLALVEEQEKKLINIK